MAPRAGEGQLVQYEQYERPGLTYGGPGTRFVRIFRLRCRAGSQWRSETLGVLVQR